MLGLPVEFLHFAKTHANIDAQSNIRVEHKTQKRKTELMEGLRKWRYREKQREADRQLGETVVKRREAVSV